MCVYYCVKVGVRVHVPLTLYLVGHKVGSQSAPILWPHLPREYVQWLPKWMTAVPRNERQDVLCEASNVRDAGRKKAVVGFWGDFLMREIEAVLL